MLSNAARGSRRPLGRWVRPCNYFQPDTARLKEMLFLHIGQAGVQMGRELWDLFAEEHKMSLDGRLIEFQKDEEIVSSFPLFTDNDGSFSPRAVFVDSDPGCIDSLRTGKYRNLYRRKLMISGKEDSASNFARAHYGFGREKLNHVQHTIRKIIEECDNFDGFIFTYSISGGTGSGFTTLLAHALDTEYGKQSKISFNLFPSFDYSNSVVEPYNIMLSIEFVLEYFDASIMFDNQTMYSYCQSKLGISQPRYVDLNRLIAQVISNTTSTIRFGGQSLDLSELLTNLLPFPRIRFCVSSLSPPVDSVNVLTDQLFDVSNFLINFRQSGNGMKFMSSCVSYRGDIVISEVIRSVQNLRDKFHEKDIVFTDWSPTGIKIGLSNHHSIFPSLHEPEKYEKVDRLASMICCHSSIGRNFRQIGKKFDLLFPKRAFVHWFVNERAEEPEFTNGREELATLERDYQEAAASTLQ